MPLVGVLPHSQEHEGCSYPLLGQSKLRRASVHFGMSRRLQASRAALVAVCFAAAVLGTNGAISSNVIAGVVQLAPVQSTCCGTVRVLVHSRRGRLIESAPVAADSTFQLINLPEQPNGLYVLQLIGTTVHDYNPLLVRLDRGSVAGVLNRDSPVILPPGFDSDKWTADSELTFQPVAKTNYLRQRAPWRLRDLWRYRYTFVQFAAVAFVVWFPRFIQDLPQDLREELLGEKEPNIGDPNAVLKAVTGRPVEQAVNSGPQR